MDYEQYSGHMLRYYDNPSNDARNTHEAKWARYYRKEFDTPGSALREVALALQDVTRDRNVIELACGHCRWTPFIAEVARSVLATDLAPNMLHWGQRLFAHAAVLASNVEFRLADAYRPDEIDGDFNCGVVINFFQHVPIARRDEFLVLLHAKLGSGATVFVACNHLLPRYRARLFRHDDGTLDTYGKRARPDGTRYEIIDNEISEDGLRMILEPHARGEIRYTAGQEYWWATYQIP